MSASIPPLAESADARAWLRTFSGATPLEQSERSPFPTVGDGDPVAVFLDWLGNAGRSGAAEPQSAVLSTVDSAGRPDARVVTLKDVSDGRWWVSGRVDSPKGEQLAASPAASLTFYWPQLGRQVRVSGSVGEGAEDVRRRDFVDRSATARAVAAASPQSSVLDDVAEYERAVSEGKAIVEADESFVSPQWRAWWIAGERVEFWQADPGKRHRRIRFAHNCSGYSGAELWP